MKQGLSDAKDENPPTGAGAVAEDSCSKPDPKKQHNNFTYRESRIMKDLASKALVQAYNGQMAVDCESQVIVSADASEDANDKKQLKPRVEKIRYDLGHKPDRVLADSGYFSEDNITHTHQNHMDPFICRDRETHSAMPEPAPKGRITKYLSVGDRMRHKLLTNAGRNICAKRKESVERVFGQTKEVRGFRRFLF